MKKNVRIWMSALALGIMGVLSLSTPSRAETGTIRAVFTSGGFIIGVGGGNGVLTFRGHHYLFTVTG